MVNTLYGCISSKGKEIDGNEFQIDDLKEFVNILKKNKEIHLNYFDNEKDLDLWIKVE